MEKKGAVIIFAFWVLLAALLLLTLVALINPMKSVFTPVIGSDGLNCSTPTDGYRGSCIAIKGGVLFFVLGISYYIINGLINKFK